MTFTLPVHFSEDINHLGTVVRLYDSARRKETLRDQLVAGMELSCSLLKESHGSGRELAEGIDGIEASNEAAEKLIHGNPDLFLRIEDLILRDAGIDNVTRKIITGNARRMMWFGEADSRQFNGRATITTLENLMKEVCGRAGELVEDPDRVKKRLGATITLGLAPINVAVSVLHPAFLPVVFKASSMVGTLVSRAISAQ